MSGVCKILEELGLVLLDSQFDGQAPVLQVNQAGIAQWLIFMGRSFVTFEFSSAC